MSYPHSFMAYKMLLVLYFVRAQQQFPCSSSCIIQDSSGNVMFDFSQFLNRKDLVSDDSSDNNYRLNVCGQVDWGCTGGQTFGSAVETSDYCYFLGIYNDYDGSSQCYWTLDDENSQPKLTMGGGSGLDCDKARSVEVQFVCPDDSRPPKVIPDTFHGETTPAGSCTYTFTVETCAACDTGCSSTPSPSSSLNPSPSSLLFDCARYSSGGCSYCLADECQGQCSDFYTFQLTVDGDTDGTVTPNDVEGCTCYTGTYDQESSDITFSDPDQTQAELQDENGNRVDFVFTNPKYYFTDGTADFTVYCDECTEQYTCTMHCDEGYCRDNPSECGCAIPFPWRYVEYGVSIVAAVVALFFIHMFIVAKKDNQQRMDELEETLTTEDPLLAQSQTSYGGLNRAATGGRHQEQKEQKRVDGNDNELERELEREFLLKAQTMEKMYMEQEAALMNNNDGDNDGGATDDAVSAWLREHEISSSVETLNAMREIGVVDPYDLSELDEDDVNAICVTLKKISAKRFRCAILNIQKESTTGGEDV